MVNKVNRLPRAFLHICVAATLFSLTVVGCNYPPEASFQLADDSKLPIWFSLSPGLGRADVSVTMSYYIKPNGRTAVFKLHDKQNHTLGKVTGTLMGSAPVSVKGSSQKGDAGYPSFEVITAQGVAQLIEHKKMEPKFYVVDDPALLRALIDQPLNRSTPPSSSPK